MMMFLLSALIIGASGSLHCIGMCGPLALALPLGNSRFESFWGSLLYNVGRVITYVFIGALLGLAGSSFKILGIQQLLSISLGVIIILVLLLPKISVFKITDKYIQRFFSVIRQKLGYFFKRKKLSSNFFIGIINGFLPCGLVYMAAAVAISTASTIHSALFMAFFGLGTLPLMWAVSFFGNFISVNTRIKIRKAYPYMMTIMACLLIIRGLGLGIPYLSPVAVSNSTDSIIQCHPVK